MAKKKQSFIDRHFNAIAGIVAIAVIAGVLLYANGFTFNFNVQYQGDTLNLPSSTAFKINSSNDYIVSLDMNPNNVCVGDSVTGTITSNTGVGSNCGIFSSVAAMDWQMYKIVIVDSNGIYTETNTANTIGTAKFAVACCDSQNRCGFSNSEIVTVSACNTATPTVDVSIQPHYTCSDSDGGKVYTVAGNCQDSYHQLGYSDQCLSSYAVKEYFCDSQGICQSEDIGCPKDWVCISGACHQPACSSVISPTSQSSCTVGYCDTGKTCTFTPATITMPAKCGCQ